MKNENVKDNTTIKNKYKEHYKTENINSIVKLEQDNAKNLFITKKNAIVLIKMAYILKILALKQKVKKGTFTIEYTPNANAQANASANAPANTTASAPNKTLELTYLDMLLIKDNTDKIKDFVKYNNVEIKKISLKNDSVDVKEFTNLNEIKKFLEDLENIKFDNLIETNDIQKLKQHEDDKTAIGKLEALLTINGQANVVGGKKRKYRRAIKKALKQKSVKGCVKININEKNKKRKKTLNRKIKIRNGSLRKK